MNGPGDKADYPVYPAGEATPSLGDLQTRLDLQQQVIEGLIAGLSTQLQTSLMEQDNLVGAIGQRARVTLGTQIAKGKRLTNQLGATLTGQMVDQLATQQSMVDMLTPPPPVPPPAPTVGILPIAPGRQCGLSADGGATIQATPAQVAALNADAAAGQIRWDQAAGVYLPASPPGNLTGIGPWLSLTISCGPEPAAPPGSSPGQAPAPPAGPGGTPPSKPVTPAGPGGKCPPPTPAGFTSVQSFAGYSVGETVRGHTVVAIWVDASGNAVLVECDQSGNQLPPAPITSPPGPPVPPAVAPPAGTPTNLPGVPVTSPGKPVPEPTQEPAACVCPSCGEPVPLPAGPTAPVLVPGRRGRPVPDEVRVNTEGTVEAVFRRGERVDWDVVTDKYLASVEPTWAGIEGTEQDPLQLATRTYTPPGSGGLA